RARRGRPIERHILPLKEVLKFFLGKSVCGGEESLCKSFNYITLVISATVGWIMLAAAVFCIWEDWTYFTSIYFFFISSSTIGLGDVTPAHPEYMIGTFGVVIVGLSMVSVCIDVVREKLELMYMALLKKMLQVLVAS
ncbi:unnamed protein product, partial [Cylicostephanus goldi]